MKRSPLSPDTSTQWAAQAQYQFLDALAADPLIQYEQLAFHGGTSLHFSWRSPRFSEDLDFLIALHATQIQSIVERATNKVTEAFRAEDPGFCIELRDKTRASDRMIACELLVSHPGFIGKTLVKVEFWQVSSEYLAGYPMTLRSPTPPALMVSRVSNPVPVATLETAYCDKLTAFATRPYLKWRDIFDLWWIGTQSGARLEDHAVARQFLHNVSAYRTFEGLAPEQALRKFLRNDPIELVNKADPDLRRWIPSTLWDKMHPRITTEMVQYTFHSIQTIADAIEREARRANPAKPSHD